MRIFHNLVFDDTVEGTSAVYTTPEQNALLGMPDALSLYAIASQVSGTSPTLTVQVEQGPDERRWANRNGTAEINGTSLSTTVETTAAANDGDPNGTTRLGFVRLRIQLGGTDPKARVRIYVTGRGDQGG